MVKRYFGTDGIRGRVGEPFITPDFILKLGHAAGKVLLRHNTQGDTAKIIIGKDTRISGYMLEAALLAGLTSAGVRALLTGPLPTPGIAYLTRALRLSGGVMLSASHNPYFDNGIKFFTSGGLKLSDAMEREIEEELSKPMTYETSPCFGRAKRIEGAVDRYIEFCKSTFPSSLNLYGKKIVIDAANGASYSAAPKVFHELGAEVIPLGDQPNGYNINDQVGATDTRLLQETVIKQSADYGIAVDGDGDRLIMVDSQGKRYDGDALVYLIAKARQKNGTLGDTGVVGTVMSNMAMAEGLKRCGIPFVRAAVGDRYVFTALTERGWQVGGEASGHILVLDKHVTGDGIISALQVFWALSVLACDLSDLKNDWEPYPQLIKNVRFRDKSLQENWPLEAKKAIEASEKALGNEGRVIVRSSGTEPVVRVMVEAKEEYKARYWSDYIVSALKTEQ